MKEGAEPVLIEAEFRAQPELPLQTMAMEEAVDEEAKIVAYIKTAYQLNNEQVTTVLGYIAKNGMQYVLDKISITEGQPRTNVASFFLAALRNDYKMPVRYVPTKKIKPKREPLPEPEISEEERRISVEMLREWRLALKQSSQKL